MDTTQPVEAAAGKPELGEIASIQRDINRAFFGNTLLPSDDTLATRGRGKGLKIYEELKRDAHAGAVLAKRVMAVTSRPFEVTQASEAPLDVRAADVVRTAFESLRFKRVCKNLLDAVLKGFSVTEVMWEIRDGLVLPSRIIARDQRRFVFDLQGRLRLKTPQAPMDGEELPERKFIVHTYGGIDDSPYGLGVGNMLFWPVFFKRQDITFWLTFADKFGSPTAKGTYPRGATGDEQKKLLQALKAISQDAGVIVPEGMLIELIEANRSGTVDTYEKLARYMDEQISKAVLGETMSTTAQAAGLGSNQASVHNEVRKELAVDDADELCETLKATIVKWLVEYNAPGAALPNVAFSFEEPEDLKARAERDKVLTEMGYEPDENYIAQTYGEGWRKKPSTPLAAPGGMFTQLLGRGAPADDAEFAEGGRTRTTNRDDQDTLVVAADELASQWQSLMGGRLQDLLAAAEDSGDLASFRERVNELATAPPPPEVVESIARATFAARVVAEGRTGKGTASFGERLMAALRRVWPHA